jgi:putative membrane protein insertion efficiency factor|tara:strand:- start:771 stop:1019 length:249 start_codon:yes stop_codon:yes gene_type:complete
MNFNTIKILPFILIIKSYQWFLSPILKTNCRYLPTCSEYAILSIKEYGIIKGLYLSFKRIFSCHPYGGKGYDPIPKKIRKEF